MTVQLVLTTALGSCRTPQYVHSTMVAKFRARSSFECYSKCARSSCQKRHLELKLNRLKLAEVVKLRKSHCQDEYNSFQIIKLNYLHVV